MGLPEETVLTTTGKKKKKTLFASACNYPGGIAGFTDQRTAFRHAQRTTLQSNDFNLRVKC